MASNKEAPGINTPFEIGIFPAAFGVEPTEIVGRDPEFIAESALIPDDSTGAGVTTGSTFPVNLVKENPGSPSERGRNEKLDQS